MTSQGSSLSQADIDRVWVRVMRTARAYGIDVSGWELRVGTNQRSQQRTSWCIEDQTGQCLLALGYTRRTAYDGLTVMGDVLDLLLGFKT